MPTRTRRGAASRQRLLEAATLELVERDGALEVERVARRAGVSVGLIYRYFDSKAGLLGAVVEDFYDRYDHSVMQPNPVPGAGWPKRERERTARAVAFHYREPLTRVVLSRLHLEPGVAAIEAGRLARHIEAAARNLSLGQERGEIPRDLDVGLAGAMVLGGIRQGLAEALGRTPPPAQEIVIEQLWRFIAAAVRFRRRDA
jgi:AcrR family transcriptional regulator